jgi:iron complex transport system substrate-binding protein
VRARAAALARRPRVYFEEWDDPMISGIRWVSELIGLAGGEDCFPELARESLGRNRIIADPAEVPRRAPDIVLGSWCGKKFRPEQVAARPGWSAVPAVRSGFVREIKSALILQPGPAALTDGVRAVSDIIAEWARRA